MSTLLSVSWDGAKGYRGFDVHLVRSTTTDTATTTFHDLTVITFDDKNDEHGDSTSATVKFITNLAAAPTSDYFLTVDPNTGQVTALKTLLPDRPVPEKKIRNLLVIAQVSFGGVTKELPIRVHIHDAVKSVKLTPSPLHIRANGVARFGVLMQFDDDVTGDVSYHPGLVWNVPASSGLTVDTSGDPNGLIHAFTSTPLTPVGSEIIVTVDMPLWLGGQNGIQGKLRVITGWLDLKPVAQAIVGRGASVRADLRVRNILVLPEGFTAAQQGLFQTTAITMATLLLGDDQFRPLSDMKEQFNVFLAWIDPEADMHEGVTSLTELVPKNRLDNKNNLKVVATRLPMPTKPAATGITKTEELLWQVGLPATKDYATGPLLDFATTKQRWKDLYGDGVVKFKSATDAENAKIFEDWKKLARYAVPTQRSTMFGLVNGHPPQVVRPFDERRLEFNTMRNRRDILNLFLNNLKAEDITAPTQPDGTKNVVVGFDLWVSSSSKDVDLVMFICHAGHNCGEFQTQAHILAFGASPAKEPTVDSSSAPFLSEKPFTPSQASPLRVAVMAHELGHALTLADEYGEFESEWPASTANRAAAEATWNVQPAIELANNPPGPGLSADLTRWNWPRAAKAGLTASALTKPSQGYKVTMQAGHAAAFRPGDKVRFRNARDLLTRGPAPRSILQFPGSTRLIVVMKRPSGQPADPNVLWFTDDGGSDLTTVVPNPTVLFMPVRQPNNTDASLVHDDVRTWMSAHGPLTFETRGKDDGLPCIPKLGSPYGDNQLRPGVPQKLLKFGTALVGLHDGGNRYRCNIFHPTGTCLMRKTWNKTKFCHVCRHILVDRLDPSKHAVIDGDFQYPPLK